MIPSYATRPGVNPGRAWNGVDVSTIAVVDLLLHCLEMLSMAFIVSLMANARRDIQEAIDWENRKSPGRRPFGNIGNMMGHLAASPLTGTLRYGD